MSQTLEDRLKAGPGLKTYEFAVDGVDYKLTSLTAGQRTTVMEAVRDPKRTANAELVHMACYPLSQKTLQEVAAMDGEWIDAIAGKVMQMSGLADEAGAKN